VVIIIIMTETIRYDTIRYVGLYLRAPKS